MARLTTQDLVQGGYTGHYILGMQHRSSKNKRLHSRSGKPFFSGLSANQNDITTLIITPEQGICAVLSMNHLKVWRQVRCVAAYLLAAGCATHKTAPAPPSYPATQETALRELRSLPQVPYDRLEIITVEAEVGEQLASAVKSARQSAAQKGANALIVLHDGEFLQKAGKRILKVRRITYLAVHLL